MNKIKDIDDICRRYNIKNYIINKDGSLDVDGNVDLSRNNLKFLPLKFNVVSGNCVFEMNFLNNLKNSPVYVGGLFSCSYNQITSLKYSPREIGAFFSCGHNKLKTLEYGPERVGEGYFCWHNHLITLKGSPIYVNGIFDCSYNKLINLKYSPREINWYFNCSNNKLKTLKYSPEKVNGSYICSVNELTSLNNTPRIVYGNFDCSNNKLTTLECGPEMVYGKYDCSHNNLKNLKGCAKYIKDELVVNNNPDLYSPEGLMCCEPKDIECKNTIFYNVWNLFQDVSKIELFNDMDIIRENSSGNPTIILDRLNEFLNIIGNPRVKHVEGYINI